MSKMTKKLPNKTSEGVVITPIESTQPEWEEDFIEQLRTPKSNYSNKERWLVDYVKSLLSQQKQSLKKRIERLNKNVPRIQVGDRSIAGLIIKTESYNEALSDVLKALEEI